MGWGSGNIGGGGVQLNFAVKRFGTEAELLAASPKKNTIGVISEVDINGYAFSSAQPADPVDGMVWFLTGTSSITAFNALKKNTLQVYPLSGKQYVDGAWNDVTVMIYQNGSWVSWWNGELFQDGDQFEAVTGGWEAMGFDLNGSWTKTAPTLEIGETMRVSLSRSSVGAFAGVAITRKKIDLTNWDTLTVFTRELSISKACEYKSGFSIFVLNSNDNTKLLQDVAVANETIHTGTAAITKTDITTDLDVSTLDGEYYVAIRTTLAPKSGGSAIAADIANMLLLKSDSLLAVYRAELDAAYQEGVNSI